MSAQPGYSEIVYVRSDTTAPGTADKVDGIKEFSISRSVDLEETTDFKDGSGYKSRLAKLKDSSIDLSGHYEAADAPQTSFRTAYGSGATVYVTVIVDPTASAGSQGFRIPCLVESYDVKGAADGAGEFSVKLSGNGAPTAV